MNENFPYNKSHCYTWAPFNARQGPPNWLIASSNEMNDIAYRSKLWVHFLPRQTSSTLKWSESRHINCLLRTCITKLQTGIFSSIQVATQETKIKTKKIPRRDKGGGNKAPSVLTPAHHQILLQTKGKSYDNPLTERCYKQFNEIQSDRQRRTVHISSTKQSHSSIFQRGNTVVHLHKLSRHLWEWPIILPCILILVPISLE